MDNEKKDMSLIGRLLFNLENKFCHNFKLFIGRNEKTIEILFLTIYSGLQIILAVYASNLFVTIIIISFLFFLALERIFIHVWLEYSRKKLENRGRIIIEKTKELLTLHRERLLKENKNLNKKR